MLVLSLVLSLGIAQAQNAPVDNISNAVRAGNASEIGRYFSASVDITINNSQSTYSRPQGEMVLRDFFNKNAPQGYSVQHTGNSGSGNIVYSIGQLTTASGKYRVYISLKEKDNSYTVKEIRIEK